MSSLTRTVLEFDKEDIDRLDEALKRFWDLRGNRGYPDWSPGEALYEPILSFVVLRVQNRLEKATWVIMVLSAVLVALTVAFTVRQF